MKNDINDILNDMFASSSGGQSKVARDAQAFLDSLNKNNKSISDEIQRQSIEIEKLDTEVKKDIANVEKRLEEDGFVLEKKQDEPEENDVKTVFSKMFSVVSKDVIGQDEFLKKLELSFKRPFVMGTENSAPATSVIVTGKIGTGRHSAINTCVEYLGKHKLIKGSTPCYIDLGLYTSSEHSKLFLQDVFSAVKSETTVIVFENYDKCHKSLLNNIKDMVLTGKVQLNSRYANQKGMLIDVGTALVANSISSISLEGKFLFFITTNPVAKVTDTMGSSFTNAINDVCATSSFEDGKLPLIGEKILGELCDKVKEKLDFNIIYDNVISSFFASKYTMQYGINSIDEYAEKCYKLLCEHKLESFVDSAEFNVEISEDVLVFNSEEKIIKVETEKRDDNQALTEVKAQFDEIIGLSEVKEYIFSLEQNYRLNKVRKSMGLKAETPSMHMIFTGNPGTGKTTIARIVSRYLKAIGVLTGGQLIEVTRADLVGRYVGHTAPLTKQIIESAIGGVLFIDEAYSLCRGSDDSFGLESIDTLVKGMEDNRDNLIVILAGYTKEMEDFLKTNSGLKSRFPNVIEFVDYTAKELFEITKLIVRNKGYKLSGDVEDVLVPYFEVSQKENSRTAGNGRLARNLVENAILNQSNRLIKENSTDYETLVVADFEI